MSEQKATPSWARANIADPEVRRFFVRLLEAKAVKE